MHATSTRCRCNIGQASHVGRGRRLATRPAACAACEVSVPLRPATVRFAVLAAIVAAQTLLIGYSGPRILQSLERVAWLTATANGVFDTSRATIEALPALASGLLPLLLAAALGAAAAWSLRAYSSAPRHIEGLGGPIAGLVFGQCALLGLWLWLLPVATASDGWQYDGYGYTLRPPATAGSTTVTATPC
jgi:hypothetical protein